MPVAAAYDRLIAAAAPETHAIPAEPTAWLKRHHPGVAKLATPLILRWRTSNIRALRSDAARAAFETVLPALIAGLAAAADPAVAAVAAAVE